MITDEPSRSAAVFTIADALAIGTLHVPDVHTDLLARGRKALSDVIGAETAYRTKLRFIHLHAKIGLDMIREYRAQRSRQEGG